MIDTLRNEHGERLDAAWTPGTPAADGAEPLVVVIGHGVTANKDRAWAVTLAAALDAAGHATLRFSFSGNGASDGDFRDSTVTREVSDLGAVLDALPGRRICYAGHSMGAAVGVLRAARDRRIERLVSLAGMVHTGAFVERKFGGLVPGRDLMWDKPECPLSQAFVDDMRTIGSTLPVAPSIRVPWLLVHGTADTVVPCDESLALCEAATCPVELVTLDGADHLFAGAHEAAMASAVVSWLARAGAA